MVNLSSCFLAPSNEALEFDCSLIFQVYQFLYKTQFFSCLVNIYRVVKSSNFPQTFYPASRPNIFYPEIHEVDLWQV